MFNHFFFHLCFILICSNQTVKPDWPLLFSKIDGQQAQAFELFNANDLPIPLGRTRYHQQGIQRLSDGSWAVSGSARDSGYLYFADINGLIHTILYLPDDLQLNERDRAIKYNHPGGFQIANDLLAVGLENTDLRRRSYGRVVLFDVSDPHNPKHLSHLDIVRPAEANKIVTAGTVSITALKQHYLIVVGNWDARQLDFYLTSSKDLSDPRTSISDCLGTWHADESFRAYQNINIYGKSLKQLYLFGLASEGQSTDWGDFYRLDVSDWNNITVEKQAERQFQGAGEGPRFVHGAGSWYDAVQNRIQIFSINRNLKDGRARCASW